MVVRDLLAKQDWPALKSYFSERAPADAQEFEARALLALNLGSESTDWTRVVGDLQSACALNPGNALLRANLAQALLDSRRPREAHEQARQAMELQPAAYPPAEKLALAAAALHRWDEALEHALRACQLLGPDRQPPSATATLIAQLKPRWWRPIQVAGMTLRRPAESDLTFLARTFGDRHFMELYHRFQPDGAIALRKFMLAAQLSPFHSRRVDWVIESSAGKVVGLGALVDIDWPNRRAEMLVGLPGEHRNAAALQASVAMLSFAFRGLALEKVVSYVYGDNPRAQANTLHLGFAQEGLLRSHVATDTGRVDLYANGLLRTGFLEDVRLQRLCRRWGLDATQGAKVSDQ